MWDFSLSGSIGAMLKTMPFIVVRIVVYFGIAIAYLIATGAGGAIGYGFTSFGDGDGGGAGIGAFIGFAGASGVLYWFRELLLYYIKAGHIAVLVHVHDHDKLPMGKGQVEFAIAEVKEVFKETSMLLVLDQLIKGVIKVITGLTNTLGMLLPIEAVQTLIRVGNAILKMSLTYVDELILAQILRTKTDNPWETGRQALVLYAQNYGKMVKNAVWLWLFMWIITIFIFVLLLAPMIALISIFPGDAGGWGFVIAFVFAWAFRAALIEPLAIYALMQVYFKTIEGQVPDPEWDARLEKASKKFVELKDKALKATGLGPKPVVPEEV